MNTIASSAIERPHRKNHEIIMSQEKYFIGTYDSRKMLRNHPRRQKRNLNDHNTLVLDIVLLTVSIVIIIVLILGVSWFCYQRIKESRKGVKVQISNEYPEIAVIKSRVLSVDNRSQDSGDDTSDVSSVWDSVSQKFDKRYLEEKEMYDLSIEGMKSWLEVGTKERNDNASTFNNDNSASI